MLRKICCFYTLLFAVGLFAQQFPVTKKTPASITKFGIRYQDDYGWLENMQAQEVLNWRNAQNEVTNQHLDSVHQQWSCLSKIKEYRHFSSNPLPNKRRKYYYSMYIRDKNRAPALYYREKLTDDAIKLANPYKIYKDENARLFDYSPSVNSKLIALEMNGSGADVTEVRFINIDNRNLLEDVITNVKSELAWNQEAGVFYKKNTNVRTFAKDSTFQLFYHKIGTLQKDDLLVFDTTDSENSFTYETAEDKLIIREINKNDRSKTYYQASLKTEPFILEKFIDHDTSDFDYLTYRNGRVYFSSKAYDWGEVRSFDINNRMDEKVIVPQIYTHLLNGCGFYGDYLVCKYRTLGKNYLIVYNKEGGFVRRFDVPAGMDFVVNFFNPETQNLFVTFFSYTVPYLNYTLNLETGKSNPYFNQFLPPKPTLFPLDYFETKSVTYKSRDNEDIPITIVYKKGLVLDGNNPTLLKAYGGYGTVSGPSYNVGLLYFLEKGGVFAYAEIRGGGEKGAKWHTAGKGLNKVNTFNDFIDAAEFLIAEKYTSPQKLAITGTSHGGLVVGVAMTKRPDLFKVAIPRMGVFDMAQYGRFTVGEINYYEYGNPEKKKEYQSLLGYSPYHNIAENVNYPTTLIITSENDDRVPPVHSYKLAAKLQNRAAQKNPIYLKTIGNSGHSGRAAVFNDYLSEEADFYNFLLYHLNR